MKQKLSLASVVCAFALMFVQKSAAQMPQPFSSDLTMTTNGAVNMKGKMFFSAPRVRMEMSPAGGSAPRGPMGGRMVMIMDGDSKTSYMLMPEQQMYMEFPADGNSPMTGRMPKLTDFSSVPCKGRQDVTCKKIGTETVNGRACDKWELTDKSGEKSYFWIDQNLHFPIKSQSKDATMEFTNIKEGAQDAALFKVPAGYRKLDAGGMGRPH